MLLLTKVVEALRRLFAVVWKANVLSRVHSARSCKSAVFKVACGSGGVLAPLEEHPATYSNNIHNMAFFIGKTPCFNPPGANVF